MEKYGVDETVNQDVLVKAANEGCPACGSEVKKYGDILVCPKCGTEPFEGKRK